MFCWSMFVLLLLFIVLHVLLRLTLSDYPIGIFKLFFQDMFEVFHIAHILYSLCQVCNSLFVNRRRNVEYYSYLAIYLNTPLVSCSLRFHCLFWFLRCKSCVIFYKLSDKVRCLNMVRTNLNVTNYQKNKRVLWYRGKLLRVVRSLLNSKGELRSRLLGRRRCIA